MMRGAVAGGRGPGNILLNDALIDPLLGFILWFREIENLCLSKGDQIPWSDSECATGYATTSIDCVQFSHPAVYDSRYSNIEERDVPHF